MNCRNSLRWLQCPFCNIELENTGTFFSWTIPLPKYVPPWLFIELKKCKHGEINPFKIAKWAAHLTDTTECGCYKTVSIHYFTFQIVNLLATLNIITVSTGFTGLKSPDTQSSEAAFDETTCLLQEIDGIMGEFNMKYNILLTKITFGFCIGFFIYILKVSLFQNVLLVSSFGPKYQRKIWQTSALESK